MFHWAKPKMASFLRSNFGFEFGAKVCLFWSLWQVIPDWLVLEATGCEQRELSLLCCGSTSMIPAATGEAHFCAPAFSYVLRSKKGPLLCHIVLLQFP